MKRFWIVLLGLLLVLLFGGGYWVMTHVLPYSSIKPYKMLAVGLPEFSQGHLPHQNGFSNYETLSVTTTDGYVLKGYWLKAEAPKANLILLHGISDCKERNYKFAKRLMSIGCNVVLFDLRAHGESGGEYCTFGAKEKEDIKLIANLIAARDTLTLGIFGNSLGGAVALQALAITPQIQFGIIESTFHSFPDVTLEYADHYIGFKNKWVTDYVIAESGRIAGFDPFSVLPYKSCEQIKVPIFMAHGTADAAIPLSFGRINFEHLASTDKVFVAVEGAGHIGLMKTGEPDYWLKMKAFIEKRYHHAIHSGI